MSKKKKTPVRIAGGENPFSSLLKAFIGVDPMYDENTISSAERIDEMIALGVDFLGKVPPSKSRELASDLFLQQTLILFLQMQEITVSRLRVIKAGLDIADVDNVVQAIDSMESSIVAQCKSVIHNMKDAMGMESETTVEPVAPTGSTVH